MKKGNGVDMVADQNLQTSIIYVNGEFLNSQDAKISVFDHVILYGDGVFDTLCAWNRAIFKLDEHIDRLYESAHAVKLDIPLSKLELRKIIIETVRINHLSEAYVKVIVTRGVGAQPLMSPYHCKTGLIVFAVPFVSLVSGQKSETGIRMIVSSMRRIPNECISTKIKSCNYLNHILMRLEANEAGVDDAVELDVEGYVCEAPGYNIFMIKKGILYTPRENILFGITRQTVIELSEIRGLSVVEARIQPFDLYNADEVFLTSTAGGIFSVVELDGRRIGNGKPGPITAQLREGYLSLLMSKTKSMPVE
jgi:branched-chain amino acid aminotransferase